jgi:hypothetical protein
MLDAERQSNRAGVPIILLASGLLLVVYLLTLARIHTWEAIAYAGRLDGNPWVSERWLTTQFFHPHHLFYLSLGSLFEVVLGIPGITRDPIRVLQIANCFLGAGCALFMGSIIARTTGSTRRGLFCALGFGLSNGVWQSSTDVGVMIPSLFFFLLGLFFIQRIGGRRGHLGAGVFVGLSVLMNQVMVILALAVSISCLHRGPAEGPEGDSHKGRSRHLLLFTSTWLALSSGSGEGGLFKLPLGNDLLTAGRVTANSFVSLYLHLEMGSWATPLARGLLLFLLITLALASIAGALLMIKARRTLPSAFLAVVLGMALLAGFMLFVRTGREEHWVYVAALSWFVIGFRSPRKVPPPPGALRTFVAGWLALLAVTNLFATILPLRDSGRAYYKSLIQFADGRFSSGDLLINGQFGPVVQGELVYLAYFCQVDAIRIPDPDSEDHEEEFRRRLIAAFERGTPGDHKIFASEEALSLLERLGVNPEETEHVATFRGSRIFRLPHTTETLLGADGSE